MRTKADQFNQETTFLWRDIHLVLPVSHEPTLAKGLISDVTDSRFLRAEYPGGKPLLLTYGLWLAHQHDQRELLLPKCDAVAAKLDSLKQNEMGT